jgi:hypothetical protein
MPETRASLPGTTEVTASCPTIVSVVWALRTRNSEPPRNSMPGLRPRIAMVPAHSSTSSRAIPYHFFRWPTKSNDRRPV